MSLHYQGSPSAQVVQASITGYGATLRKPADYGDFTTEPKLTNDSRKSLTGKDFAANPTHVITTRSKTLVGTSSWLASASNFSEYLNDINYIEGASTAKTATAIRGGYFNISTGKFTVGYPNASTDSFGNDNAARSSYNSPGSVSYRVGNTITTRNYDAKG
tara:strand:- start:435 stop:917 length:483 start_codon:yes stop_codon:yes gene_type:complete